MKIQSTRGPNGIVAGGKAAASAASGFAVPAEGAERAAAPGAATPASSLDAVLALQAEHCDPRRRGRQARCGAKTLDALEELTKALLGNGSPASARLQLVALQAEREATGDRGLDQVLDEIDLRAAVELAKLEVADRGRG